MRPDLRSGVSVAAVVLFRRGRGVVVVVPLAILNFLSLRQLLVVGVDVMVVLLILMMVLGIRVGRGFFVIRVDVVVVLLVMVLEIRIDRGFVVFGVDVVAGFLIMVRMRIRIC